MTFLIIHVLAQRWSHKFIFQTGGYFTVLESTEGNVWKDAPCLMANEADFTVHFNKHSASIWF